LVEEGTGKGGGGGKREGHQSRTNREPIEKAGIRGVLGGGSQGARRWPKSRAERRESRGSTE